MNASAMPQLPVPVLTGPHWRVNIRPTEYVPARISTLTESFEVIRRSQVRLRGSDYPYLSPDPRERSQGTSWIEAWGDFGGQSEYWRFYQSAQFIHLFGVHEATNERRRAEIEDLAKKRIFAPQGVDFSAVPGFVSIMNVLHTVTEIFEFAARLSEKALLGEACTVAIDIRKIKGFLLTVSDPERIFRQYCAAGQDTLGNAWTCEKERLLADSAGLALEASRWFYERFGWMEPNMDVLMRDQQNFLAGRM